MMIKLNELVDKYGEYEIDENKLKEFLVEPKPKNKTVYNLQDGIEYFYINEFGDVYSTIWTHSNADLKRRDAGNCFLTREEAEFEVKRRNIEAILLKYGRREFKNGKHNYFFCYDYENNLIRKAIADTRQSQGTIFFDNDELIDQAIKEIGKNLIKECISGVKNQ